MSRRCDLLAVGVMSGNKVSHSNRKTRRRFLPNLKTIALHSDSLGVDLTLKVAISTLRTINKYGNIDNFLVNYGFAKLTVLGQTLRNKIKRKLIKTGKLEEVKVINVGVKKSARIKEIHKKVAVKAA